MTPPSDPAALLTQHAGRLSAFLANVLGRQAQAGAPPRLVEAIDYSLSAGGKRLRPALVLETFAMASSGPSPSGERSGEGEATDDKLTRGSEPAQTEDVPAHPSPLPRWKGDQTALAAAGAMELIHTFSLVHDDLPAMDDDDLRRGRPTNHKVFGEAMAILAGDAMMTLAFELIASEADADLVAPLVRELARASGPAGMIGGQVLDIDGENKSLELTQLQQIHRLKTGALLTASCRLGAIAARASEAEVEAVARFGQHLGLAFQIIDDVLDETSTPEQLGKATNKDAGRGKNTYPRLLGLEESKREAARQMQSAIDALDLFGERAGRLIALARFVVERSR